MNPSSSLRLRISSDYLAAAAVTLAPLCYFFRAVQGQLVISPDDGIIFNIPLRVAAANIMRAGYLPLWNPYIFSGMPLHGAAQAGLLFPLNWTYLVFSAPVATNVMMLATYMLAALGAYLYARRSGSLVAGAVVTSLAWQWSSFLIAHIGHTNILQTAAMLPWILWAIDGYGMSDTGDQRRRRGVLLAVLVAIQCFTGHQQTFAYSLLLAAAYALVMARGSHGSPERKTAYFRSLVFLAAGILLAAVQIVPTFELLRNSTRSAVDYNYFTSFSLPPRFVLTLLAPYLMGGGDGLLFRAQYVGPTFYAEYVAYVGVISVMLALLALLLRPDKITKFWAIVVVVGLLLALGSYAPFGLYKLIVFVPVLNLFRVPARHLMEVDFALAVLAGRGLSAVVRARSDPRTMRRVKLAGLVIVALTLLTVTLGKPANFRLGREAPVSFLRAPEFFLPVVFSLLAAWAVWRFARGRRGATVLLLSVLVIDLAVWGQSSGWRVASAPRDFELWGEPETVRFLRQRAAEEGGQPYRILTQDQPFDPIVPTEPPAGGPWVPTLQPDVYMMHRIENAAGYDGFGLLRYSRLAGDMKVWGELTDPERTLRSDSRELDLLNVRYLLTRPISDPGGKNAPTSGAFPGATVEFGGIKFAADDLNSPRIDDAAKLVFVSPPIEVDGVAIVTNLSWSVNVPDDTAVARIRLFTEGGKIFDFDLRAGEHTAEWAHDRPDIQAQIKHRRPPVATSYKVDDGREVYEAHSYVASFQLPERAIVKGGEISLEPMKAAPDLVLTVLRVSLFDQAGNNSFPLSRESFKKQSSSGATPASQQSVAKNPQESANQLSNNPQQTKERWHELSQLENVIVFENTRVLPRAWLTTNVMTLNDEETLQVIRTALLPNGQPWDPAQTALVQGPVEFTPGKPDSSASVNVNSHGPNNVRITSKSAAPAILVLTENHYPGWKAYVDGRPVETLRVDYNLRGVVLTAGQHEIEFLYRPKSVLLGFAISLFSLIGVLLWWKRVLPWI
ncbi:MAG: YfhO family protein [Pyrinomonadaceae bacterium]